MKTKEDIVRLSSSPTLDFSEQTLRSMKHSGEFKVNHFSRDNYIQEYSQFSHIHYDLFMQGNHLNIFFILTKSFPNCSFVMTITMKEINLFLSGSLENFHSTFGDIISKFFLL